MCSFHCRRSSAPSNHFHFLNKNIEITIKVKCGARISLEDKKYGRGSSLTIFYLCSVKFFFSEKLLRLNVVF
jgi:hypothetical protein